MAEFGLTDDFIQRVVAYVDTLWKDAIPFDTMTTLARDSKTGMQGSVGVCTDE